MTDAERRFLELRFNNIEARQTALELELVDYMEQNPKVDESWTEERLRALESGIRTLREAYFALEAQVKALQDILRQ